MEVEVIKMLEISPQNASRHYYTGIDLNRSKNDLEQDRTTNDKEHHIGLFLCVTVVR